MWCVVRMIVVCGVRVKVVCGEVIVVCGEGDCGVWWVWRDDAARTREVQQTGWGAGNEGGSGRKGRARPPLPPPPPPPPPPHTTSTHQHQHHLDGGGVIFPFGQGGAEVLKAGPHERLVQ